MTRPLALRRAGAALALPLVLGLVSCSDDSGETPESSRTESTPTDDSVENPDGSGDKAAGSGTKRGQRDGAKAGKGNAGASKGADSPLGSLNVDTGERVPGKKFAAVTQWALDNATTADIDLRTTAQGGISGSGQLDRTTSPLSLQMNIEVNGSKGDVRLVDGAMYMATDEMGKGKYLKLDVSNPSGSAPDLSELDPSGSLRDGVGKKKFTYRGVETIDGVSARRFSAPDVDIWFDDRGFLRRVERDLGANGIVTGTYSNWGKPVEISAPPADRVQEMPSLPMAPRG